VRDGARALLRDVADASRGRKSEARLALARFYAANGLMAEANGPLSAMMADDQAMRGQREAALPEGADRGAHASQSGGDHRLRCRPDQGGCRSWPLARFAGAETWAATPRRSSVFAAREASSIAIPQEMQAELRFAKARAALAMQDLTVAEREIERLSNLPRGLVDPENSRSCAPSSTMSAAGRKRP
jgi:hypothetical protein